MVNYFFSMKSFDSEMQITYINSVNKALQFIDTHLDSIGLEHITSAYDTLVKWATPLDLLDNPDTKMVTIYHDSFKTTDPQKVRFSACISLSQPIKVSGNIGRTSIENGKFYYWKFCN